MPSKPSFNTTEHKLKGRIKRIVRKTFYADSTGELNKNRFALFEREFNEDFSIRLSRSVEINGLQNFHYQYSYDLNTVRQQYIKTDGSDGFYFTFTLDSEGRPLEKLQYSNDRLAEREVYLYDDEDMRESYVCYNSAGRISKRLITVSEQNGRKKNIYLTENEKDVTIFVKTHIEPDSDITLIMNAKKEVQKIQAVVRDKHGNLVKQTESGPAGVNLSGTTYTNEYDEKNQRTSETCYRLSKELQWKRIYSYDKVGNCTLEQTYIPDKTNTANLILDKQIDSEIDYWD